MKKAYEYIVYENKPMDKTLLEFLQDLGKERWQLVSWNGGHTYIFMREII